MTILEDLKAGRLVVVPREATAEMRQAGERAWMDRDLTRDDSDPIKDCFAAMLTAAPSHTAGLIALVEGMAAERECAVEDRRLSYNLQAAAVRQRDTAIAEREEAWATVLEVQGHADSWRDRALAAEAEVNAQDRIIIATKRERDAAEAERDEAREQVGKLALLLDQQMGTPCEQIRHQQVVDGIRAEIDHAVINDLRLAPVFGQRQGDLAVRISSLEAVLDRG
jgi:hypothetical protein